jgi:hypothetical protein
VLESGSNLRHRRLVGDRDRLDAELDRLSRDQPGIAPASGQRDQPELVRVSSHDVGRLGPDRSGRPEQHHLTLPALPNSSAGMHAAILPATGDDRDNAPPLRTKPDPINMKSSRHLAPGSRHVDVG